MPNVVHIEHPGALHPPQGEPGMHAAPRLPTHFRDAVVAVAIIFVLALAYLGWSVTRGAPDDRDVDARIAAANQAAQSRRTGTAGTAAAAGNRILERQQGRRAEEKELLGEDTRAPAGMPR